MFTNLCIWRSRHPCSSCARSRRPASFNARDTRIRVGLPIVAIASHNTASVNPLTDFCPFLRGGLELLFGGQRELTADLSQPEDRPVSSLLGTLCAVLQEAFALLEGRARS